MSEHDTGDGLSLTALYLKHTALAAQVHGHGEELDKIGVRLQPFDQGNGSSVKTQVEVMRREISSIGDTLKRFEDLLHWFDERKGEIVNVIRLRRTAGAIAAAILIGIGVDVWARLTHHDANAQTPVTASIDVQALKKELAQSIVESIRSQADSTPSSKRYESVPAARRRPKSQSRLFDPGQLRDADMGLPANSRPQSVREGK